MPIRKACMFEFLHACRKLGIEGIIAGWIYRNDIF
jgi:hypothetical protein